MKGKQMDATREQAIDWCKAKMCDFKTPVYPPPEGWMWADSGDRLVLSPIFTTTDQGDEITSAETGAWQFSNAIN